MALSHFPLEDIMTVKITLLAMWVFFLYLFIPETIILATIAALSIIGLIILLFNIKVNRRIKNLPVAVLTVERRKIKFRYSKFSKDGITTFLGFIHSDQPNSTGSFQFFSISKEIEVIDVKLPSSQELKPYVPAVISLEDENLEFLMTKSVDQCQCDVPTPHWIRYEYFGDILQKQNETFIGSLYCSVTDYRFRR